MKKAILLALVGVGTAMVVRELMCRRARPCTDTEPEELGRWESEGGAPHPGPDAPAYRREVTELPAF